MNDFLSWCMHLLVPFIFAVTSLHPPSFSIMCWLTRPPRARAHTGERPLNSRVYTQMVFHRHLAWRPAIYRKDVRLKQNDRSMSVHTSIDFRDINSKKISAEACSGKEIAGLLKKKRE